MPNSVPGGVCFHTDVETCVDAILARVGKNVVLGLPVGIGKANHVANALYARAVADPNIHLKIFTALTLEKHLDGPELSQRLINPIIERLFGTYPDLEYAKGIRAGTLPRNIEVCEFYLMAGRWLHVAKVQQSYVSVNYSQAPQLLLQYGVNVIAQLVAKHEQDGHAVFSLSSNPEVTLDILPEIERRKKAGIPIMVVGQVNSELPFMAGDAALAASAFDHILDAPAYEFSLFAPPKEEVILAHHATALHIASLVKDGGTLQIGIGALGDAIAWALILRHRQNAAFRDAIACLRSASPVGGALELEPFNEGLYGVSEMFVDGFLELYRAGILKRCAADGALLHAGFFVGCKDFYRDLRNMKEAERASFRMSPISYTNEIGGEDEAQKREDRRDASFINSAMMVTLLGEVISDTREDGQVVSGVGGQYDFVTQAHALAGGRAIIAINATRTVKGRVLSNVHFSYGACTIPRHLRDIVVTEYGIADLKGKSDCDVVATMLNIADSRFQTDLLRQAQAAGKIERDYKIPPPFLENYPNRLHQKMRHARDSGILPDYPFGTDLTAVEQNLAVALERLNHITASLLGLAGALFRSLFVSVKSEIAREALQRINLDGASKVKEKVLRRLVVLALTETVSALPR